MTALPGAAALAAQTLSRVEQMLLHSLHDLSEAAGFGADPGGGPIVPPSVREPAEQLYAWAPLTASRHPLHTPPQFNEASSFHQPGISAWDVSKATGPYAMMCMFCDSALASDECSKQELREDWRCTRTGCSKYWVYTAWSDVAAFTREYGPGGIYTGDILSLIHI